MKFSTRFCDGLRSYLTKIHQGQFFFITFLNYEQKLLFQLRKILIQNVLYYIYLKGKVNFKDSLSGD